MSNTIHLISRQVTRSLVAPTLFGELGEAARANLIAKAPLRQFQPGQIIAQRGDRPTGIWVIQHGVVKIGQFRANGEFRGIAMLAAGDSYGELAVFSNSRRAVDAVADSDAALYWIEAASFEAELMKDPAAMRKLIGALSMQMQELLGQIGAVGNTSATARLAALLLNLAGPEAGHTVIALGQHKLAEMLGLTRATINKALGQLEAEGAIERGYGRVTIGDKTTLLGHITD